MIETPETIQAKFQTNIQAFQNERSLSGAVIRELLLNEVQRRIECQGAG